MKTQELTAQEMAAARLLLDSQTKGHAAVASETGISLRTLERRMKTPAFRAYQDKVRKEQDKKLEAKTDAVLKKIAFDKPDLVALLIKIASTDASVTNDRYVDQVNAAKLLAEIMSWMPKPGLQPAGQAAPEAEKPDVYQAEWMRERRSN